MKSAWSPAIASPYCHAVLWSFLLISSTKTNSLPQPAEWSQMMSQYSHCASSSRSWAVLWSSLCVSSFLQIGLESTLWDSNVIVNGEPPNKLIQICICFHVVDFLDSSNDSTNYNSWSAYEARPRQVTIEFSKDIVPVKHAGSRNTQTLHDQFCYIEFHLKHSLVFSDVLCSLVTSSHPFCPTCPFEILASSSFHSFSAAFPHLHHIHHINHRCNMPGLSWNHLRTFWAVMEHHQKHHGYI